jgi:anti-sigma factor RsiW
VSHDWHSDPERLGDDLAAYALDTLDRGEADLLERHLGECEQCREHLLWLRPAVDVLPASVTQLSPPASLRESLLATVRAEAPTARPQRRAWWRGLGTSALRPAAAVGFAVLIIAAAVTGYLARGGDDGARSELVSAQPLGPQAAQVSATLERHGDAATLHISELPGLGRDEVHEVWVQRDGALEPASTFVLGLDGTAEAAVPGPLEGADAVLVTAEPRPGSRQPTTEPLLQAPL